MAASRAIWRSTPEGQAYVARYRKSQKRKRVLARYYSSGKGRAAIDRYQKTPKGAESLLRGVHKRRARLKQIVCDLTAKQWQEIQARQNHACAMCKKASALTRDHVVPISKGGSHTAANIQALCRSCNSKKGNR
jgi:5-methylcytosine-specific restriction endonuclease McrA